jgi:hypothetical protein
MSLIESYCSICKNYKFNLEKGVICGLTNERPSFWEECSDFKKDRKREKEILVKARDRSKRFTRLESYDDGGPKIHRLLNFGISIIFYIVVNILTYLGLSEANAFKIIMLSIVYIPVIILIMSLRYLLPNERIVIFTPRKGTKVLGPGLVLVFPFTTKYVRINLDEKLPGWTEINNLDVDLWLKRTMKTSN